jgi:hypothetical protein
MKKNEAVRVIEGKGRHVGILCKEKLMFVSLFPISSCMLLDAFTHFAFKEPRNGALDAGALHFLL